MSYSTCDIFQWGKWRHRRGRRGTQNAAASAWWSACPDSPGPCARQALAVYPFATAAHHEGVCACVLSRCSCVRLFVTPWAIARQAPLSVGFSRQEYWSGLPCPPPGGLPDPGTEPRSPALQADALPPSRRESRGGAHTHVNHCRHSQWLQCWPQPSSEGLAAGSRVDG